MAITSNNENQPLSLKAEVLQLLFDSYRPRYWYFEVIECTRRLALTAVLSVIATGSSAQIVLAMMVSFGYICLYTYCQPYKEIENSVLATVGQMQIYFTFFGALIINNDLLGSGWNLIVGALLVVLNMAVILTSFKGELSSDHASRNEEVVLERGLPKAWKDGRKEGDSNRLNPLQQDWSDEIDSVDLGSKNIKAKTVELIHMKKKQNIIDSTTVDTSEYSLEEQAKKEMKVLFKKYTYLEEKYRLLSLRSATENAELSQQIALLTNKLLVYESVSSNLVVNSADHF